MRWSTSACEVGRDHVRGRVDHLVRQRDAGVHEGEAVARAPGRTARRCPAGPPPSPLRPEAGPHEVGHRRVRLAGHHRAPRRWRSRPRRGSRRRPGSARPAWGRSRRRWWRAAGRRGAPPWRRSAGARSRSRGGSPTITASASPSRDRHGAAALDGLDHPRSAAHEHPLARLARATAAAMAEVMTSPSAGIAVAGQLGLHLAHRLARVVGDEHHRLARRAQPRHGVRGAGDRLVREPDHAVEVECEGHRPACQTRTVARFEPFAGIRYDLARSDLGRVIAPPYDVIDAAPARRAGRPRPAQRGAHRPPRRSRRRPALRGGPRPARASGSPTAPSWSTSGPASRSTA